MSLPLNWPTSLDSFANPSPTQETDDPGFELDLVISRIHNLLMLMEARFGVGGVSTPATVGHVLRSASAGAATWGLLGDANVAAVGTANIAVGKLAPSGPGNEVLATGGSAPAAWQKVVQAMLANGSVGTAQLIANAATFLSTVAIGSNTYAGSAWNTLTGSTIAWTTQGGPVLFLVSLASVFSSSGSENMQVGVWNNNTAGVQASLGLQNINSGNNTTFMGHYAYTPAAGAQSFSVAWNTTGGIVMNAPSGTFTAIELRR